MGSLSKRIFKNFACRNRFRIRKNGFASRSKLRKDQTTDAEDLIIHDMLIPNPFYLKTVKNFTKLFDLPLHRLLQAGSCRLLFLASRFVCLSFTRCFLFTIQSRHLGTVMYKIIIQTTNSVIKAQIDKRTLSLLATTVISTVKV